MSDRCPTDPCAVLRLLAGAGLLAGPAAVRREREQPPQDGASAGLLAGASAGLLAAVRRERERPPLATGLESAHPLAATWLRNGARMPRDLIDGYFAAPRRHREKTMQSAGQSECCQSGVTASTGCATEEERFRDGGMRSGRRVRASSTSGDDCATDDERCCSTSSTPLASCRPSCEVSFELKAAPVSDKAIFEPVAAAAPLLPHDPSVMPRVADLLQQRVVAAYARRDEALAEDDDWSARLHEVEAERQHRELLRVVRRIVPARRIVGFEVAAAV
ncbi:hypothetical protein TSOC_008981 [Tetrabaena socialis]|uniref:Uncharacterized protein n=1 Tax=Tetrabaena socialis TaxID=47790 RepID=A0A2J7ZX01_9CHLO|nr:hypothetical protein TSOC_008981 [Tetrabaena socialis]|eukprot:PNH04789.1 hypothetical protein TSOC_008981 [Tetrabaena socialis]